ncbi:GyrI-like domain-containing protein [Candidatus Dependentiae bacterium]
MTKISEIEVVDFPNYKVIGLREKGPYAKIGEMVPKLYLYMISKNMTFAGSPIFICHEHNAEEACKADKAGTADLEVCIPVQGAVQSEGEFKTYNLPGCKMAKIVRTGPYQECDQIFQKLYSWLAQNNYKIAGNTREVYLNNPVEAKPEELLTEIYTPIERENHTK